MMTIRVASVCASGKSLTCSRRMHQMGFGELEGLKGVDLSRSLTCIIHHRVSSGCEPHSSRKRPRDFFDAEATGPDDPDTGHSTFRKPERQTPASWLEQRPPGGSAPANHHAIRCGGSGVLPHNWHCFQRGLHCEGAGADRVPPMGECTRADR